MSDIDFQEQIALEELARRKEESQQTYTDKDGTVFEWDLEKKAWFPKIDEDFIAKYQMNYGANSAAETSEGKDSSNADGATADSNDADAQKKYEQYCKDYYNYYGVEYQPPSDENSTSDQQYSNINPETGQEFKDYAEYYAYYYGQEYADYYKEFSQSDVSAPGLNQEQQPKKLSKKELKRQKAGEKRKMAPTKEEPKWFEHETEGSTHVYVSGLPTDVTDQEFIELMSKYGLIMFDPFSKKPKTKLYKDSEGNIKGDGLCCYIKRESVDLCLKLLDGLDVRGSKVSVEKAKFEMKGSFDPTKKKKLTNKQKRKMKENQEKLFEWKLDKPAEVRLKHERIVILKNMFDVKEFEADVTLINELREEVRAECVKFGDVKKVVLYDRQPEGVMSVMFKTAEEADACIEALNGRWFAKKQIKAETWDGKAKYEIEETEEQKAERLKTWDQYLEADTGDKKTASEDKEKKSTTEASSSSDKDVSNVDTVTDNVDSSTASESNTSSVQAMNTNTIADPDSNSLEQEKPMEASS